MIDPMGDDEMHAEESHPDYEYATTRNFDTYPPSGGEGWTENRHRGIDHSGYQRLEYGSEAYWMRKKTDRFLSPQRVREHFPMSLDDLLADAGIRLPKEF